MNCDDLRVKHAALEEELRVTKRECQSSKNRLEIEKLKEDHTTKVTSDERARLQAELATLTAEIARKSSMTFVSPEAQQKLEVGVDGLKADNAKLQKDLAEQKSQGGELQQKNKELNDELVSIRTALKMNKDQLKDNIVRVLGDKLTNCDELNRKYTELVTTCEMANSDRTRVSNELAELKGNMGKNTSDMSSENSRLSQELETAKNGQSNFLAAITAEIKKIDENLNYNPGNLQQAGSAIVNITRYYEQKTNEKLTSEHKTLDDDALKVLGVSGGKTLVVALNDALKNISAATKKIDNSISDDPVDIVNALKRMDAAVDGISNWKKLLVFMFGNHMDANELIDSIQHILSIGPNDKTNAWANASRKLTDSQGTIDKLTHERLNMQLVPTERLCGYHQLYK